MSFSPQSDTIEVCGASLSGYGVSERRQRPPCPADGQDRRPGPASTKAMVPRGATLCTRAHFTPNSAPNSFLWSNLGDKKVGLHLGKMTPFYSLLRGTCRHPNCREIGENGIQETPLPLRRCRLFYEEKSDAENSDPGRGEADGVLHTSRPHTAGGTYFVSDTSVRLRVMRCHCLPLQAGIR